MRVGAINTEKHKLSSQQKQMKKKKCAGKFSMSCHKEET